MDIPEQVGPDADPGRASGTGMRRFWPRPRIRRPVDVPRLVIAGVALVVLVLLAIVDTDLLRGLADLLPDLAPGLLRTTLSILNVIVSLTVAALLLAVLVEAAHSRRFALTSAALSCSLALLVGFTVTAVVAGTAGSAAISQLVGPPTGSAGLPITAAVAVIVGADLQQGRLRVVARLAVAAAIACALVLGSLTVPSAAYAALVGATVGMAVRVVIGVVPARPSTEAIRAVIERAGWRLSALRTINEAAGRASFDGDREDGDPLRITVLDKDRRGVTLVRRGWRLLRLRTAAVGRPALSLRGQLERQVISSALVQSAGVAAPRALALLATGPALVLVEQPLVGTPFAAAADPDLPAGAVAAAGALRHLHNAGLAHCAVTAEAIVLLPDGTAGFVHLVSAQPAATELQRELDAVALLVALTTRLPAEAAVTAFRAGYRSTAPAEARFAALMQPVALPAPSRRANRRTTRLKDLRAVLTHSGTDSAATAPRLERVRTRTLVSVIAGSLAAYILVAQLSRISLADALRPDAPAWLVAALGGSAVTYLGSALAKHAFLPIRLPLGRTALVQVASSFLTLVTPPAVGHIGLNVRYLQRAGVGVATAAACIGVSEAVTILVTVLLLIVCGWLSGVSSSQLTLLPSGTVLVVLAGAAAVLGLVLALPPSRRLIRRRVEPLLRRTIPQLLATAGDPRRLAVALAGILLLNGGYVLALYGSLNAYSATISIPVLVVVYLASSTVGSVAPTPGGLGAVEAALVAGLTAAGVPVTAAVTAVLAFRAATFWLPVPVGWGAFVLLQRRQFV